MNESGSDGGGITKNKRKSFYENPREILSLSSPLPLTELPKCGISEQKLEKLTSEFGSSEELEKNFQELELNDDEWDVPIACQLQELLSQNLQLSLHGAVEKIVHCGYTKEFSEQLILTCGLYHGLKDVVTNAAEGALAFMRARKESGCSGHPVFQDLNKLVEFCLLEMVNILRQLKPCASVAEAMWCLLLCDLNLWHSLALRTDQLGLVSLQEISGDTSSDLSPSRLKLEAFKETFYTRHISKLLALKENPVNWAYNPPPNLKNFHSCDVSGKEISVSHFLKPLDISRKQTETHATVVEEKSVGGRKGSLANFKRDMLHQKMFGFEKSHKARMSKGCYKSKLISAGSKALDKALKVSPGSSCAVTKSTCSNLATPVRASSSILDGTDRDLRNSTPAPQFPDTSGMSSVKDTDFSSPVVDDKGPASLSPNSEFIAKTEANNDEHSLEAPDCVDVMHDNKSLGKYIPKDDKEETILALFSRMKALRKEIQDWTDWANEKVMQATRRLTKDQVELKMLRQGKEESEKFKKENQTTEESTIKRLSEMEHALSNATVQIEASTLALRKLEDENSLIKSVAEAAKMKAHRTLSDLQETMKREEETAKKIRSAELIKVSLQEELAGLRHHRADVLRQQKIARGRAEQLEVLWRREEGEKLKYHADSMRKRSETAREEAKAKAVEEKMRGEAESFIQRCKEDIKKLEAENFKWRSLSESPILAALLGGAGTGFASSSIENLLASSYQEFKATKRLAVFQDNSGADSVTPERECIMCLTEEMCVVFLPCAHQVLCLDCNVLHEKQGMADCPSCRTPIQERFSVRFKEP